MYLQQKINVNLTKENADILKKPSKIFNSIKAKFHGGLTPTQERQAAVMLSFLQRLNIALRQSKFDRLASVSVNDEIIYEGTNSQSLNESSEALETGFSSGEITKVNTLALTVDAVKDQLNYLIHVSLVRKPKRGASPISIQVFGFISEFKRVEGEDIDVFSKRVKQLIKTHWGSKQKREARLSALEEKFTSEISMLQNKIDLLFPMKSSMADMQRSLKQKGFISHIHYHSELYEDIYCYLPYFFENFEHIDYAAEGYIIDQTESWDRDTVYHDSESASNWSDFGSSDSFSDSSSCGSSCGGGCGGD